MSSESSNKVEKILQEDLDNLADILWWIKGYIAGAKDNYESCPFGDDHFESLRKVRKYLGQDKWISVDEKMPEIGANIIGATPIENGVWRIRTGRFRSPEDHGGQAVIDLGNEGWSWISHWRPLEPPNGL